MMIYFIGGSPCSGKSTLAASLAARYDLIHFRADDHLDALIDGGAAAGLPVCQHIRSLSPEETWMRSPAVQCREELDFYLETAPLLHQRLMHLDAPAVIAEGAAFMPQLMRAWAIPRQQYIAITPSREFQISRYRERPWVPHVLQGCNDPEAAFLRWMERDALFAEDVRRQCARCGMLHLLTDGSIPPEERLTQAAAHFGLPLR